jgi:hypothetical protein
MARNWATFYRSEQKRRQQTQAEGEHRPAPYELWPVDADGNRVPPPWGDDPGNYQDPSQYQEPTP